MKRSSDGAPVAAAEPLVLPHAHALSLELARESAALLDDADWAARSGVRSCAVLSPGLVELVLHAGSAQGYGARPWPLRVGGAGLGDAPELAAAIGAPPRAPLAVRFAVPVAGFCMAGVDDAGFVDASFWTPALAARPSLRAIAERAVSWLRGEHVADDAADDADGAADADAAAARRRAWRDTQAHALRKLRVIEAWRPRAARAELVAERARLRAEWLCPAFRPLLAADGAAARAAAARELVAPTADEPRAVREVGGAGSGVYRFALFTAGLREALLAELDAFERSELPRRRPNTMNRAGLIANEIGMHALMGAVLDVVVAPLAAALYGAREPFARALDHHHSFFVRYTADEAAGGDRGLDMHHDASEVTLNVCLGRAFAGAGLLFCGRFGDADHRRARAVVAHEPGYALLHLGRQRHGADAISAGERVNLIVWARSSAFRAAAAFGHVDPDGYPPKPEDGAPDRLCLSKTNDADYKRALEALDAAAAAEGGAAK